MEKNSEKISILDIVYLLLMKRRFLNKLSFFLIVTLVCLGEVSGQESFDGFSVNPQIGVYYVTTSDDGGFLAGLQFSKLKNNTIYSVDYYHFGEFTLMDPLPANSYNQVGFMIGKYNHHKYWRLVYQCGIAPFFGKIYSEDVGGDPGTSSYQYYSTDKFFTLGLAGKLGFRLLLTKHIALGADFHANLNLKQSLFFPCIALEIGKLKD